jgi:hypothetical protein
MFVCRLLRWLGISSTLSERSPEQQLHFSDFGMGNATGEVGKD